VRNPLGLLLPALVPSWNFFDVIAPSPRVEYAVSDSPVGEPDWRAFRPRPDRVSPLAMLGRLFWNPRWNQTLFVVSCAERLADQFTGHSQDELFRRIGADLGIEASGRWLRFRLVFVRREGEAIVAEELFASEARRIGDLR
jgi:hypothetical protein